MKTYKVAIVIVTFNNSRHIDDLFEGLTNYVDRSDVVVVIVDNNSSDDTVDKIKQKEYSGLVLIEESVNHGFGVGNNIGIAAVDAEYYFLLNSDAYFVTNTLDQTLDMIEPVDDLGVFGVPMVFPDGSPQTYIYSTTTAKKLLLQISRIKDILLWLAGVRALRMLFSCYRPAKTYFDSKLQLNFDRSNPVPLDPTPEIVDVDWVCGAGMVLSKQLIEKTGGFDPAIFMYGEDEDLCIQAREHKLRVVSARISPIIHEFGWGKNKKKGYSKIKRDSLVVFFAKRNKGLKLAVMVFLLDLYLRVSA